MTILHMETDTVRAVAGQLAQTVEFIQAEMQSAAQSANNADWMGGSRDQFMEEMTRLSHAIIQQADAAKVLSRRVESEVQDWEEATATLSASGIGSAVIGGGGGTGGDGPLPIPVPTPTPKPDPSSNEDASLPEDMIRLLDDLLKPIDWISNSADATRKFNKALEDLGRLLNGMTGQRGNIKMMSEFGDFLRNAEKGAGFLSNLLDLRDMNSYFAGELTNAEVALVAIKKLFPIPILNDRLAKFMVDNMVDPTGHWHGLVTPAY